MFNSSFSLTFIVFFCCVLFLFLCCVHCIAVRFALLMLSFHPMSHLSDATTSRAERFSQHNSHSYQLLIKRNINSIYSSMNYYCSADISFVINCHLCHRCRRRRFHTHKRNRINLNYKILMITKKNFV